MGKMDPASETTPYFAKVSYARGSDEEPRKSRKIATGSMSSDVYYRPRFSKEMQPKSDGQEKERTRESKALIGELNQLKGLPDIPG